jgi:hypothetical protein
MKLLCACWLGIVLCLSVGCASAPKPVRKVSYELTIEYPDGRVERYGGWEYEE